MMNPADGLWGGLSDEGIRTGILGVIGRDEADIGIGDMAASYDSILFTQEGI